MGVALMVATECKRLRIIYMPFIFDFYTIFTVGSAPLNIRMASVQW